MLPGVYDNRQEGILASVGALQAELDNAGIALELIAGADIHVVPDLVEGLGAGRLPCLGRSRHFLFEPPHHVVPPGLLRLGEAACEAGFVPILTHPERLTWIESNYDLICQLDEAGLVVQVTAGSLTGGFGKRAQYWAERMLHEGRVDIIASDAHDPRRRPPVMSRARDMVAQRLGDATALSMTTGNPSAILANRPLPAKQRIGAPQPSGSLSNLRKFFGLT